MTSDDVVRRELAETADDFDYVGIHTWIALAGKRYITTDGMLMLRRGEVALINPGDEPVEQRILAVDEVRNVEVVSKPWWGFGTSMILKVGDTTYRVEPEAIAQGSGLATPGKIRRARASVRAFEAALQTSTRVGE